MSGIRPWIIALLLAPGAVTGADDPAAAPADRVLVAARQALSRQDYAGAAGMLREAVGTSPTNADYHNLYAFAVRRGPSPDMDLVFRHYREALRLDPKHRGAHEYIGEAYLAVGELARAKEHLAQLDRLCFFGCEEYADLKSAIAAYEARSRR